MVNIYTCYFLLLIHFSIRCGETRNFKGYGDLPTMEEIRVPPESNITLQCDADKCNTKYDIIQWTFSGKQIPMNKRCMNLQLTNVTARFSGIYMCLLNNAISHTYKVDVIEPPKYDSILPKVLSVTPSNATVPQYTNIVVRCLTGTSARAPPHVFWFKRTASKETAVRDALTYGNYSYVKISDGSVGASGLAGSPHSVPNEPNVYLSKLSILNATVKDSGIYACMAMTELGSDVQYFVVEVVTGNSHRVTETLSLLFLIPFFFALIPSVVWLCYAHCYHRKQKAKCKLAVAEGPVVDVCAYSLSPRQQHHLHHHQHNHPRQLDINMVRMLRMGDGASSMPSVTSSPEAGRLLQKPKALAHHHTVSIV